MFRVVVAVVVLGSVDVWDAPRWGVPTPVFVLLLVSTVSVAIGFVTRVATVLSLGALLWVLGAAQSSGQVMHTHHLVWFMAVLASSPCGDALSVDAWLRRQPPVQPSIAHGLPVRLTWALIAGVFFFPGAWKLAHGTAWLEGLPALIAWKRFQFGLAPLVLSPTLVRAGGIATLAFEVLGPLLFFISSRTRVAAVVMALSFHLAVQAVLGIAFSSLWCCYVVFIAWSRRPVIPAPTWREAAPTVVLAAVLLPAVIAVGVLGREEDWPVACYPRFVEPAPATVRFVEFDGATPMTLASLRAMPTQRWWGLSTRAAMHPSEEALTALFTQWAGRPPATEVRFFATNCVVATGACERRELPR